MATGPAATPENDADEPAKWSVSAIIAAVVLAILFGVIAIAGVRGCFSPLDPQEQAKLDAEKKKKEEQEKKEKKADFELDRPAIEPTEPGVLSQYLKPGHWATTIQRMRANYRDLVGQSTTGLTNKQNLPIGIERTPFVLRSSRPVALTKGQPKNIETTFYAPPVAEESNILNELAERGLGAAIAPLSTKLTLMPSYQYHIVVLAKEPSRYSWIKTLDAINVPYSGLSEFEGRSDTLHYRVVALDITQSVALSDNPLAWSSIAYIVWDEVDPHLLTPAQQKALLDWLNWGGQIIVSGPDSLDLLKGSFLEPFLPAKNAGPRTIAAGDPALTALNRGWTISTPKVRGEPIRPAAPWSGIKLEVAPEAKSLPKTGELLVERQVGRGRIVVSAMQLAERELINWSSGFDSLFNAILLRRPNREYHEGSVGGPTLLWADSELKDRRLDARLNTNLRFFSRDLGVDTAYAYRESTDPQNVQFNQNNQMVPIREYRPPESAAGGIGAWNDFSATANAARGALREAAGVEVPGSSFVVVALAAYLTVLVPLNWLVFNTLRRVEWAWIAAPIIAIASTFIVVHRARLDIGFVRAHTEIGLMELQPDHPRALLSRYTALYTSLSTTYNLEFPNMTTVAAPFPRDANETMLIGQARTPIDFQRYDEVRLTGLPVSSASTNFVHSEQMLPLDGAIRIGKSTARGREQIENHSQFALKSAAVIYRPLPSERSQLLKGMWIGDMLPGQSVAKAWPAQFEEKEVPFEKERADEGRVQRNTRLNLEPMFRLATDLANIEPGEIRFIARVDEVLPGENITPAASQVAGATLVVAHLQYAPLLPPKPDVNTRQEIKAVNQEEPESFN